MNLNRLSERVGSNSRLKVGLQKKYLRKFDARLKTNALVYIEFKYHSLIAHEILIKLQKKSV